MYQITKLIYILIVKYMNIYNQYLRQLPVNKFIIIVHILNICNINLGSFSENSCKIYEEYGYYRADTET